MGSAVGIEVVIPQHQDHICVCRGFIDHPGFRGKSHDRMARKVHHRAQYRQEQKRHQVGDDPTVFAAMASFYGSCIRIYCAQLFRSLLRQDSVEVDFFYAVGLTALFHDRHDFDVPVIIIR